MLCAPCVLESAKALQSFSNVSDFRENTGQMNLLDKLFRSEQIEHVFSDSEYLESLLHFEAALARAEAKIGLISEPAARAIASKCRADLFDQKTITDGAALAGNIAIPVVRQLTALVAKENEEAAHFVHWGATSQDAMDTAVVLQLRRAIEFIERDLRTLVDTLAALAETHRNTPVVARTWMQQALPTTFGFIVAGWLDAILRDRLRLEELRARALTLQFGGAVGTSSCARRRRPRGGEGARRGSSPHASGSTLAQPTRPLRGSGNHSRSFLWNACKNRFGHFSPRTNGSWRTV